MPKTSPYGSWKSPITSDLIVQGGIGLGQIQFDGDDLYWVEQRPSEAGRNVVVKRTRDGKISDVTPAPFNARTRVHEYGGAAYVVDRGTVYFSNYADQRVYRHDLGSAPRAITPAVDLRYADAVIDRARNRLIAVREDHTGSGEAVNTIVALNLNGDDAGRSAKILVHGKNFYSNPRLNAAGTKLAWLQWNHPNMPWDGTELWVAELDGRGEVASPKKIAGGENESIFQPEWAPDGALYFVSDRTGWWNLYRERNGQVEAMHPRAAEFGVPLWVFGLTTYAIESASRIVCTYSQLGSHLAILDTSTRQLDEIKTPYTSLGNPRVSNGRVAFIAGSASQPSSLVLLDLKTRKLDVLRRSTEIKIDPGYISTPQAIEFPTENKLTAHAIYYPPTNKDFSAEKNSKPPLIVKSHGGPTSATGTTLNLGIQYWTSRGFAVVDVNYGGSTGYGRAYRERLNGTWGVVDVDDCVNAAKHLVKKNLADGKRLAITGGSAGGYTTLTAIALRNVFTAAASHFGIGDLEIFAKDTHKYESRYLDRLVGPYPEKRDVYRARSAMNFVDNINCPLILFQGLEDKIVPPNQSQMMFDAVKKKGIPCAYVAFEGEQHGFRQAKNIKRSLDGELYFYSKVFGFELADKVEPVKIQNLPQRIQGTQRKKVAVRKARKVTEGTRKKAGVRNKGTGAKKTRGKKK